LAIFLLVRHGDNHSIGKFLAGRSPNVHLNEKGRKQAQDLAACLVGLPIKAVISSPLERAQETAEPIAQALGLAVEIMADFNEVDFGEWEGKGLEDLRKDALWNDVQERPGQIRFPGGENLQESQNRVVEGLLMLNTKYAEKDYVVCVAHCDVVRLAVAYFLGVPLDNLQRIQVFPASISILSLNGKSAKLGAINYTINLSDSLD